MVGGVLLLPLSFSSLFFLFYGSLWIWAAVEKCHKLGGLSATETSHSSGGREVQDGGIHRLGVWALRFLVCNSAILLHPHPHRVEGMNEFSGISFRRDHSKGIYLHNIVTPEMPHFLVPSLWGLNFNLWIKRKGGTKFKSKTTTSSNAVREKVWKNPWRGDERD